MKVLLTAQSFGYGPASKLIEIAKLLRLIYDKRLKLEFVGQSVALTHISQNSHYFDKLIEGDVQKIKDAYDFAFAVSVMEPITVIWALKNKKKVIYVDSLSWFWHWNKNDQDRINHIIATIKESKNFIETLKIVNTMNSHDLQYIAHKLATISCVQSFSPDNSNQKNEIVFRNKSKLLKVDPIIDVSFKETVPKKDLIMITLSGMLSPINQLQDALRYSRVVVNLLSEFLKSAPEDMEIYLTANPEVIKNLKIKNSRIQLHSFDKDSFLKLLNRTVILLTPPGITTMFEGLNYNVPLIILPEQHDGHYPNYLRLRKKYETLSQLRDIFPEILFRTRLKSKPKNEPDDEIEEIQRIIQNLEINRESLLATNIKDSLKNFQFLLRDKSARKDLLIAQQKHLLVSKRVLDTETLRLILKKIGIEIY